MTYPGGKGGAGVAQTLINLMPPHDLYIEPFLGMGAVMRNKRPAARSFGIDADIFAVAEWANHGIPGLTVDVGDGIQFLKTYPRFHSRALVYCDPPYIIESRSSQRRIYRCELAVKDHERLLEIIRWLKCLVMVSGYSHPLYESQLSGWNRVEYQAMTRGGTKKTEVVWMNYPPPRELHDYSFYGSTFREREKFKRRQARWKRRLLSMPLLERQSMLAALQDVSMPARTDRPGGTAGDIAPRGDN